MILFECKRLSAKITKRQCGVNRLNIISCKGCAGLGESAQITLPSQEEASVKKKKIQCSHHGCGYGVKKEGDFCKKHEDGVVLPIEDQKTGLEVAKTQGEKTEKTIAPDAGNLTGDDTENLSHAPQSAVTGKETTAGYSEPVAEQPAVDDVDEIIHETKFSVPKQGGLAGLLRTPPLAQDGLLIPFTHADTVALVEANVSAEDIRQLTLMLLAGELQRVEAA